MQDRPDKAALLDAVAEFLMHDVKPYITDPALGFRVLIAANLASVAAREERLEAAHDGAQLDRLRWLLPDVDVRELTSEAALLQLNVSLADRVRNGGIPENRHADLWSHVTETLREKLAVINPRFDTSLTYN